MIKILIVKIYQNIYYMTNNILFKIKKIDVSKTTGIKVIGFPFIKNKGTFTIRSNVKINSTYRANPIGGMKTCTFIVEMNANLIIDKGAQMSNIAINCKKQIYIGKNVFIGGDTRIYDSDFHSLELEKRLRDIDTDIVSKAVYISSGVFIGASVLILKGVSIGENSIVGAGSVVTKDIPQNEIWAGNPAVFIRAIR